MKITPLKCPECQAPLEIKKGSNIAHCKYCNIQISIQDENEYIYRHIDEARMRELDIIEQEHNEETRQKQLEAQRIAESSYANTIKKIYITNVCFAVSFLESYLCFWVF